MDYSKASAPVASQSGAESAKPYYIEAADGMFNAFMDMAHKDMVEAFKYLQKRLCEARFEQNKNMQAELEKYSSDVKMHDEGTAKIASQL